MYDLINDLMQTDDLLEVKRHLITIDEAIERNEVNRSQFCKLLSSTIIEWSVMPRSSIFQPEKDKRYHIYSAETSIAPYLASVGLMLGRVSEVRKHIKEIIADIDATIIEPTGICTTVEQEEMVLAVLLEKFSYLEVVSTRKPLSVLNINNTHRLFNSTCGVDESASAFVIHMYNMKNISFIPEYVFLHELGHALQAAMSGSVLTVPDEFIDFHNSLPGTPRIEHGNTDAPELFADAFAIAVMRGTELYRFDPFHFSDGLKGLFEAFFEELFTTRGY